MWPLVAVLLLMYSEAYLLDDPTRSIFLADAIKVIAVLMLFFGSTKSLVSAEREHKKFEKEIEIIEV